MKIYVITKRTYENDDYTDIPVVAFKQKSDAENYLEEDNHRHLYAIDEIEIQNPQIIEDFDKVVR